jgi:hypothetical protein
MNLVVDKMYGYKDLDSLVPDLIDKEILLERYIISNIIKRPNVDISYKIETSMPIENIEYKYMVNVKIYEQYKWV